MDKISILTKLKLLGYFWLVLFLVIIENLAFWYLYHTYYNIVPEYLKILFLLEIIPNLIGLYYFVRIISGYKNRLKIYSMFYKMFSKNIANGRPIKTYGLYNLRKTPCGNVVVKQLCKDFNIKL